MKIENGMDLGIGAERDLGGESDPISLGRLRSEVEMNQRKFRHRGNGAQFQDGHSVGGE